MLSYFDASYALQTLRHMSVTFHLLVAMSVVASAIGLERFFFLRRALGRLRASHAQIVHQLQHHGPQRAQAVNESLPGHLGTPSYSLLLEGTKTASGPIKRAIARAVRRARKRLWLLGSLGSIAPFVGLLGTVLGVMNAFRAMGAEGAGGFAVVSSGISEALNTTAAGIFVAVEAVILYNSLQVLCGTYANEIREALEEAAEAMQEAPGDH